MLLSLTIVLLREDIIDALGLLLALAGLVILMAEPARCALGPRDNLLEASETAIVVHSSKNGWLRFDVDIWAEGYPPLRDSIVYMRGTDGMYLVVRLRKEKLNGGDRCDLKKTVAGNKRDRGRLDQGMLSIITWSAYGITKKSLDSHEGSAWVILCIMDDRRAGHTRSRSPVCQGVRKHVPHYGYIA